MQIDSQLLVELESVGLQVDPPQHRVLVSEITPHAHIGALLRIACVMTVDREERSRPVWRDRRTLIDTCLGDSIVVASPTVGDYCRPCRRTGWFPKAF